MSIIGSYLPSPVINNNITLLGPPSLARSLYKMESFLFSRLSVSVVVIGAFGAVITAATTTVTQSDEQSGPSIPRSFINIIQSIGRHTLSSFQQQYPLLREGDLSLYRMVQCLTLCSLLPGLWFLRSRRQTSNDGTDGAARSWRAELKSHHKRPGSIGSTDSALRNGMSE